jgi:uncharacterized repeat protein (TIGR03803 family)
MQRQAERFGPARRTTGFSFIFVAALVLLASLSQPAPAQTYTVIHNFTGKGADGASPYGGPILDQAGNLLGTTYLGGTFGSGTVYKLSRSGSSWAAATLHNFAGYQDGAGPAFGSLAMYHSAVFGTTEGGVPFGTVFRVSLCKSGCQETIVHRFFMGKDGAQPIGGVVVDAAGNLYGTTSEFGANGFGTAFQIAPNGVETVIYTFVGGTDVANPAAGVTLDAAGNLYGTCSFCGAFGTGAVYKLSPSASGWTETILYNFLGEDDGAYPVGGLVFDKAGNLYGGTFASGANGGGTVYQLSPSGGSWNFTTLYSFRGSFGGPYNKLTFDASGSLYGIANADGANGLGSVFKLTPSNGAWTFTDLHDFAGGSDGSLPYGSVAVDAHGNVFGTAAVGGSDNQGLVFEITQ